MKPVRTVFAPLFAITLLAGCASTPSATPVSPTETLIWSSQPNRPGWIDKQPETSGGVMSFVGLSKRVATEQGTRDAALRHARQNVVSYMGTLVKNKYESAATSYGLSGDVINPTESARIYEKLLAVNLAKHVKASEYYLEKWQTPTGVGNQAFCLAHVPQASVDESYKATAQDMARKAEQQAKEANDDIAKDQAEKAAAFWKQMQEQGLTE